VKTPLLLLALLLLLDVNRLGAQAVEAVASPGESTDINQWADSVVRIISQDGDGDFFHTQTADTVDFGTGFVINDAGYIVTNNHVASKSPDTGEAHSLCVVVETVTTAAGPKRYLHKATAVWFSPANDLAVLQCSGLHVKPIPFDFTPPRDGEEVHSFGYPTVSDLIAGGAPEFSNFFVALANSLSPDWEDHDSWEITDTVNHRAWATYFKPTRTDGGIRDADLIEGPWGGSGDDNAQVPVIQHSLDIMPGNSGGPLLSDHGGVIGVVGDGMQDKENGDQNIHTNYATTIAPLVTWLDGVVIPGLDDRHHYYQLGFSTPPPASSPLTAILLQTTLVMIIFGLLLALVLEFVILRFTWQKVEQSRLVPAGGPAAAPLPPLHATEAERWPDLFREFMRWIPVHMPHPAPFFGFWKRHLGLAGVLGLVVLGTSSLIFHSMSNEGTSTNTSAHLNPSPWTSPGTQTLSPEQLAKSEAGSAVQPTGGLAPHFWHAISVFGRVALIGLVVMIAWRVIAGVVRFLKRPRK
jgi:S1-C subfamily serine protease